MKENYRDLSELLKNSVPAEAFFSQVPENLQAKAMAHSGMIHSTRALRSMVRAWSREEEA